MSADNIRLRLSLYASDSQPSPLCDGGRVLVEDAGESFLAYCALCKGVGKVALEVAA